MSDLTEWQKDLVADLEKEVYYLTQSYIKDIPEASIANITIELKFNWNKETDGYYH